MTLLEELEQYRPWNEQEARDRVELVRVPFPDQEARTFSFEKHFQSIIQLEDGRIARDSEVMDR